MVNINATSGIESVEIMFVHRCFANGARVVCLSKVIADKRDKNIGVCS